MRGNVCQPFGGSLNCGLRPDGRAAPNALRSAMLGRFWSGRRRMYRSVLVSLGLFAGVSAASAEDAAERGRALVQDNCATCHAVGPEGESPLAAAPPFRILGQRYPLTD